MIHHFVETEDPQCVNCARLASARRSTGWAWLKVYQYNHAAVLIIPNLELRNFNDVGPMSSRWAGTGLLIHKTLAYQSTP